MTTDIEASQIDLAVTRDFTVGGAQVRPSLREIEAEGTVETLEPRVMQVLVLLAEMEGRTVSRDLMVERCWGGVIVGEDAIQRCVGRLRKVADATGAFEIITLSRVGYRLNARAPVAGNTQSERLLAVLPFDNLSNDPDFDYFADGVSEEILQSIARGSSIRVIGRTSSFQYRGQDKTIPRIARDLGATYILDGSVRRSGTLLRVSAHLVELSDQTMLWTDRFDGDIDNPFDLQDEVARGAVEALKGVFREKAASAPVSGASFESLLKLRKLVRQTSFGSEDEAVLNAINTLAPDSAEAWGIVAKVRAAQRWSSPVSLEPHLRAEAEMAAERALVLDPQCGGAHKALFMLEPPAGRFAACEDRLERARAATPEDTEILWSLYFHYLAVGRLGSSFEMAEEAYRLDPLRPPNVIAYANALFTANETKQSLALMQHALDRWQSDPVIFAITLWTATVDGRHDFARALLRSDWKARYAQAGHVLMDWAVFAARGLLDDPAALAAQAADRLRAAVDAGQVEISLTGLCAFLGMDLDELYDLVDRMPLEQLQQPGSQLRPLDGLSHLFLRVNARLRENPRFVELCRRLGLIDYWTATGNWPECVAEVANAYDFKALCQA